MSTLDPEVLRRIRELSNFPLMTAPLRHRVSHELAPMWSHCAAWTDLVAFRRVPPQPGLPQGWQSRWAVTYRHAKHVRTDAVADISLGELLTTDAIRTTAWHRNSRTRAGLQYLTSTRRSHWHESQFERRVLQAFDFHGVRMIATQPFTLRWWDVAGVVRKHTPDFLVATSDGVILVNVRPESLVKPELLESCAAAAAVAMALDWDSVLITDFVRPPMTVIETLFATADADDPFQSALSMLEHLHDHGPQRFGDLAAREHAPAVARAVLQQLIWARAVTVDLQQLLGDTTVVALPDQEPLS